MITEHVDIDKHHCGILSVLEFENLPFVPQRAFWVTHVPQGEERGNHAHHKTEQVLICVQGVIMVRIDRGRGTTEQILRPGESVYVGRMSWDSQVFLTGNDMLLVIASTKYDKGDYIEDKEFFLEELSKKTAGGIVE